MVFKRKYAIGLSVLNDLLAELDAAEQVKMQVHDSLATVLTAVVDDAVAVLQVFRAIVYQRFTSL